MDGSTTDFDVPAHEPAVLSRVHFEEWAQRYLDSDPESRLRDPAGVKTPLGPFQMVVRRLLPIGGEARYQDRPRYPFDASGGDATGALAGERPFPARP
jgi:hypothetical protein